MSQWPSWPPANLPPEGQARSSLPAPLFATGPPAGQARDKVADPAADKGGSHTCRLAFISSLPAHLISTGLMVPTEHVRVAIEKLKQEAEAIKKDR